MDAVASARLPGIIWIEEQMFQRNQKLVPARDDVGGTDDRGRCGLAEQFREGFAVGFTEGDDLMQDRYQLPRVVPSPSAANSSMPSLFHVT